MTVCQYTITVPPPQVIEIIVGERGPQGEPGEDGSVWFQGAGTPPDSLGAPGDFYLDTESSDVYQKIDDSWVLVGNIQGEPGDPGGPPGPAGAPGAPGSVWRDGSGPPADALGIDGDYYLDNLTGNVYAKAAGTYSISSNIQGPQGPPGTGGGTGGGLTSLNKSMPAETTASPFDLACAIPIALTPSNDSYVDVQVNGVGGYRLGDAEWTQDFYFSSDGGTTAKAIADIASGDLLYVGAALPFQLDPTDQISFLYGA